MRIAILCLIHFLPFSTTFAQQDSLKLLLDQGIALNDKGDYAGAIENYDKIIRQDNNYYLAYNEKTLSLYSAGKYQESIDLCKTVLKKFRDNEGNDKIYANYGSSQDALGNPDEAIKIYKEGIKKYPDSYLLSFNKGISEYNQKKIDEAITDFQKSVSLKPDHTSSHQALAYCVYTKNKMAAVLSLMTFLLLEPEGQRAERNLKLMLQLLGSNVKRTDEKNITVSLSPAVLDSKNGGEDNFHLAELMISMRSALDYDDKYKDLPIAQGLEDKLEMLIPADATKKNKGRGFFTNFYIPFLEAMKTDSLLGTACHIIYTSSADMANKKWLEDNKGKVDAFAKWMSLYAWNKE